MQIQGGGGYCTFHTEKNIKRKNDFFSLFCVSLFVHVRWNQVEILDGDTQPTRGPRGGGVRIPLTLETVPIAVHNLQQSYDYSSKFI